MFWVFLQFCSVIKQYCNLKYSVGLSQTPIDTHGHLFLNNSIGCQSNFAVFLKLPLWFISFFTVVISAILVLVCLLVVEDMVQDITIQIKGCWRFPNTTHQYTNPYSTSTTVLLLMLPQFGMIYLMMFSLSNSCLFQKKAKILSLQ